MRAGSDGVDLITYLSWIGAVLAEFFIPYAPFGDRTFWDWLVFWVDKWSIRYQEAYDTWMFFPGLATGLVLLLATWLLIRRLVRRLRPRDC